MFLGPGSRAQRQRLYPGTGCGRLVFTSSTLLTYQPYNGDQIQWNGKWVTIPASGWGLTNVGLLSSIDHFYVYYNGNTIEASTAAHSASVNPDNIGVEIRTGDDSRSLVGMFTMTTSTGFADNPFSRFTRTWFNDHGVQLTVGASATFSVTTAAMSEVSAALELQVVTWNGELISDEQLGLVVLSSGLNMWGASRDGSFIAFDTVVQQTAPTGAGSTSMYNSNIITETSEGFHNFTVIARTSAGTLNFVGGVAPVSSTPNGRFLHRVTTYGRP